MNNIVATFEKVSFDQFLTDSLKTGFLKDNDDMAYAGKVWDNIKLPCRSTKFSGGYDFYFPFNYSYLKGTSVVVPTGIKVKMHDPGWLLMVAPRSSLGFKYGMRFANIPPIIDADYYYAKNEGHIMLKFSADENMCFQAGDRYAQGLIIPYGITTDDDAAGERDGGIGSTGK